MLGPVSVQVSCKMEKRKLIDEIMRINHSARPEFLAHFKESHLAEYLEHLYEISGPAEERSANSAGSRRPSAVMSS